MRGSGAVEVVKQLISEARCGKRAVRIKLKACAIVALPTSYDLLGRRARRARRPEQCGNEDDQQSCKVDMTHVAHCTSASWRCGLSVWDGLGGDLLGPPNTLLSHAHRAHLKYGTQWLAHRAVPSVRIANYGRDTRSCIG